MILLLRQGEKQMSLPASRVVECYKVPRRPRRSRLLKAAAVVYLCPRASVCARARFVFLSARSWCEWLGETRYCRQGRDQQLQLLKKLEALAGRRVVAVSGGREPTTASPSPPTPCLCLGQGRLPRPRSQLLSNPRSNPLPLFSSHKIGGSAHGGN